MDMEIKIKQKKKAYDFLVQAESRICSVNGTEEHPARVGVSICDIASGQAARGR